MRRVDFSGGRSEQIRGGPLWGSCVVALSVGGPSSAPPPVAAGGGVFSFRTDRNGMVDELSVLGFRDPAMAVNHGVRGRKG